MAQWQWRKGKKRQWWSWKSLGVAKEAAAQAAMAYRIPKGKLADMPNVEGRHTSALHVGKELELGQQHVQQRVFWVYVNAVVVVVSSWRFVCGLTSRAKKI